MPLMHEKDNKLEERKENRSPRFNRTSNLRKLSPVTPVEVSNFNLGKEKTLTRNQTCRKGLDCDSSCASTYNSTNLQNTRTKKRPQAVSEDMERQLKN